MPISSKEILKPPQKPVSKLLSISKIFGESKPTKHTQKNTSKPNTNILKNTKFIFMYYLFLPEEYCLENP